MRAPHADIFNGPAEPCKLMPFEMSDGNQRIGLNDLRADIDLEAVEEV
jgi:hypothetical protein